MLSFGADRRHSPGWLQAPHEPAIPFRDVTENTRCQEVAARRVSSPSATPNGKPTTARRQAEQPLPLGRYRRPADRRSRPQRWHDAVAELPALQAKYAVWHDALPEGLRDSVTAEALQAIVELDLDALAAIMPPRGYGCD